MFRFVSFFVYPVAAAILLSATASGWRRASAGWVVFGIVLWTLLEYVLHRFVFHWRPASPRVRAAIEAIHITHHRAPRDPAKLFVRLEYSVPISLFLLASLAAILSDAFAASLVMTGLWAGFLYYECVHYRVHCTYSASVFLGPQRLWHFHHHFIDDTIRFGVTSPLWDLVFRTNRASPAASRHPGEEGPSL